MLAHYANTSDVQASTSGKGSESLKNEIAFNLLNMFFASSTWINIHGLPHNITIVELRITEGYTLGNNLEPQMLNGHEKGWKH